MLRPDREVSWYSIDMQKGSAIIGIVLVLAVVAGVGVWWWQKGGLVQGAQTLVVATNTNQQPLNDTLAYHNEEFRYEFNYPKSVSVKEDRDPRFVDLNLDGVTLENIKSEGSKTPMTVASIRIDNPLTPNEYPSPCIWYYRERENDDVSFDPTICTGKTEQKGYDGYPTTFAGEPAYVRIKNNDGIDGGLYASKQYDIVFFHDGRPWEIHYSTPPDHPTDKWKNHPYYTYLEKSVPITQQILASFRFVE